MSERELIEIQEWLKDLGEEYTLKELKNLQELDLYKNQIKELLK